ncbi:unnamed protein product [Rhizoctonia solani]|uniref:Transposase family Tnp2 protein n=1 Tax=Rhizoctonia solani TaxID=456999 RepID=A0A8H3A5U8_9AGAM|nr:unnamed protein product [Rhizoctonia solani]
MAALKSGSDRPPNIFVDGQLRHANIASDFGVNEPKRILTAFSREATQVPLPDSPIAEARHYFDIPIEDTTISKVEESKADSKTQGIKEGNQVKDSVVNFPTIFRLLDLYQEEGSGGLVEKVLIDQECLRRLLNTLLPGSYESVSKIDFKALDKCAIKPLGIYGSKAEIIQFLLQTQEVDLIMDENMEPRAKRARTDAGTYAPCPCYNCQGDMQLLGTIRDHKKRFPWPLSSSPRARSPASNNRALQDMTNLSSPRRQNPPSTRENSPFRDNGAREPSRSPPARRHASSPDLPGFNPNDRQDHRFDDLGRNQQYVNIGVDGDLLRAGGNGDEEEEENAEEEEAGDMEAMYGLPGGDDPPREEQEFEFPWGDQNDEEPDPEPDNPIDPEEYCAAFREHPLIRNAYVDAIVQKVLYSANHRALTHQLKAAQRQLRSNPDVPAEDLSRMALTIRTVERRLGLDSDDLIMTYTLCPLCRRSYSPNDIADADNSTCQNDNCEGTLFDVKTLASGQRKRESRLTYPCVSIIAWLRRLFSQAGMAKLVQNWRTENDHGQAEPIPVDQWAVTVRMNTPLGDMSHGWGWRSGVGGLDRVVDEVTGDVEDRSPMDPPVRFSSLPFGLSFSLNTDWFQPSREGNYSVGACYLVLNNLPRHLRFLRENICLVLVMPGPKEPSDYALDQMLVPLIDELLELKQGVVINIREGNDPPVFRDRVVHAELSQHIADLIARIKMGGGAGLRSELNFCLYCRARLSSLSVPAGFIREELPYRDPEQDLNNAYFWRSLETAEERRAFFEFTGNRFTALHLLPGFYTQTCSPPDAMHLLYLGGMNWILIRTLFQPGMLTKRLRTDEDPVARFNACLNEMWLPRNFSRLPPKLGQTNTRIKADQWKLATRVVFIPLFMAFRVGDIIPNDCIPRGTKSSTAAKNQVSRAKALHRERKKHYAAIGRPRDCPELEQCFPSRNVRFHYKQVLRYCVATGTLDKRTVTPAEIRFGTDLLEAMCVEYAENNIPEPPNFHMMMHLEEAMLKYGSLYNSHVWGLERANGVLSAMNHNGRGKGMLEGTLMRGWWGIANLQNLIKMFRSLPNPTPDDEEVLENLLSALRGGPDHALQRGTLAAYLAQTKTAYTRLHGIQESVRLSNQSRVIDLHKEEHNGIYELFMEFCRRTWPHAGMFGDGMPPSELYIPRKGLIRNFSYVEHNGIRYGSFHHTSGRGYCYGYVGQEHHAARIEWVLSVDFPGRLELRPVCVIIRRFQLPEIEPEFPWSRWNINLGTASWAFNELDEPEAVAVDALSGAFALFKVPMSEADYWVSVSLDTLSPARDDPDNDE